LMQNHFLSVVPKTHMSYRASPGLHTYSGLSIHTADRDPSDKIYCDIPEVIPESFCFSLTDLARYRNFRTLTSPTPVQFSCLAVDPGGEVSRVEEGAVRGGEGRGNGVGEFCRLPCFSARCCIQFQLCRLMAVQRFTHACTHARMHAHTHTVQTLGRQDECAGRLHTKLAASLV
jgi:hypothetical protein